jgi:fucose 4-O-acetylase-like acetyltransferase
MDQFLSQKFKFFSFLSMVLLVFVHGYDLNNRYLLPFSLVSETLTINTFLQYFLANGIFRFRIPMLFIISGYLFAMRDEKPFGERTRKRVRTLLVPYLVWSAIGILVTLLFEQWQLTREAVQEANLVPWIGKPIAAYSAGELAQQWIMAPVPFQLWFIRCLLVYNLMYPWLKTAVLKIPKTYFIVAGLLWLSSFHGWIIEGEGLMFFPLGIWLNKTNADIQSPPSWLRIRPLAACWLMVAVAKTWLAFQGMIGPWIFPVLMVLHKLVSLMGLMVIWFGFDGGVRFLMNQKWFVWLSAFSFMIYAMHVPLINYALILAFAFANSIPHYRLLTFILLPTTIIGLSVVFGVLLRSIVPKAYSILTGGRGFA